MNLSVLTYKVLIDPLLSGLRKAVRQQIPAGSSFLDIACGTGSMSFHLKDHCSELVGVDLDEPKIKAAQHEVDMKGLSHLSFHVMDATRLDNFADNRFDFVHLSMAIHQFDPTLREKIIREASRVGSQVIIADYACPVPSGISGLVARFIEWLAGKEHNGNFLHYQEHGGLPELLKSMEIDYELTAVKGSGVFEVYLLKSITTG